jgi:hypothetical protein
MTSPILRPHVPTKQHGQTLAEFAISLPLVLLLLFGILEFGRMFQSWVTLQNAARSAVRYAVTGQYNEQKYDLEYLVPCYLKDQDLVKDYQPINRYNPVTKVVESQPVTIYRPASLSPLENAPAVDYEDVPLSNTDKLLKDPNNSGYPRRAYKTYTSGPNGTGNVIIEKWKPLSASIVTALKTAGHDPVRVVALNPDESLYSTWYGRDDNESCTPNDTTFEYRKDMVRLASIYDEARRGASGLALDQSLTGNGTLPEFKNFLYNYWANPSPSQEADGWFNVMICSARGRMYPEGDTQIRDNPDDKNSASSNDPTVLALSSLRFHTFRGPGKPQGGKAVDYVGGACILKEYPTPGKFKYNEMVDNYNQPWADAGSAGERVVIVITYNHPLITPLGLARFIRMQASRSAVNEAFKVVNAERALGGGGAGNDSIFSTNTPTKEGPKPNTLEPPTASYTPSLTPTDTQTPTAQPFDCALLKATDVSFSGQNTIYVKLQNDNVDDTTYLYASMVWQYTTMLATSPNAYAGFVSIENEVNWTGYQSKANKPTTAAPVNTNSPSQGDSFLDDDPATTGDVYIVGLNTTVPGNGSARWQLTFLGLTKPLYQVLKLWELGGTKIAFLNPTTGQKCLISLDVPPGEPTATPVPPNFNPTATFTPDCADINTSVAFGSFLSNGDVQLVVTNKRANPAYLLGFIIQWQGALTAVPNLKLVRVTVGGRDPYDYPSPTNPNGTGVVVWENTVGGDINAPTNSTVASDGTWRQSYAFPPAVQSPTQPTQFTPTQTNVYLDFVGVGGDSLTTRGVASNVFNGSLLRISCNPNGGNGGQGTGGNYDGDITFDTQLPPTNTLPPPPSITPAPTKPPTATYTAAPPKPPTLPTTPAPTVTASNTSKPPTATKPPPTPTFNIGGCTDTCGG